MSSTLHIKGYKSTLLKLLTLKFCLKLGPLAINYFIQILTIDYFHSEKMQNILTKNASPINYE